MLSKFLAGAVLAAAFSTAALATQVPVQKGEEAAAKAAPDDVICTYESSVGSHMKRRVCATKAAREANAQANQDGMGRLRSGRHSAGKANSEPANPGF